MRRIAYGLAGLAVASAPPALACPRAEANRYVFIQSLPRDLPEDAVVLRVRPIAGEMDSGDSLLVEVVGVLQGEWSMKRTWIDYGPANSCTRATLPSEGAFVVGEEAMSGGSLYASTYHSAELRPLKEMPQ